MQSLDRVRSSFVTCALQQPKLPLVPEDALGAIVSTEENLGPGLQIQWSQTEDEFVTHLIGQTNQIKCIISQHLRSGQTCELSDKSEWQFGSYNVCIPVAIIGASVHRLALKCPLPYRFQGRYDLMDEKVRCEAGTSVWISQNCTRVPIPKLWGFGLSTGLNFISAAHLPWYRRVGLVLGNLWSWLRCRPTYRQFVSFQRPASLKSSYVLMDYIEEGVMLSSVLPPRTPKEKNNLYKSVAGMMLDLAQPLCKIGSFTVDNRGHISLSNRPLTMMLANLEIDGISTNIPQDRCYLEADSYFSDLLYCHDLRLTHLPNSVRDINDGEGQIAVLTMMRSLIAPMTQRDLKSGPFAFRMTDLNTSNFLVDDQFNITALIDLEWFCSLPMETLTPPFWLSGHYVDDLLEDEEHPQPLEQIQTNIKDFEKMCEEFLVFYEKEDLSRPSLPAPGSQTRVMKIAIERRTYWLWLALNNPRILYNIFIEHIQPIFAPLHLYNPGATHFQKTLAPYWSIEALQVLRGKVLEDQRRLSRLSQSDQ